MRLLKSAATWFAAPLLGAVLIVALACDRARPADGYLSDSLGSDTIGPQTTGVPAPGAATTGPQNADPAPLDYEAMRRSAPNGYEATPGLAPIGPEPGNSGGLDSVDPSEAAQLWRDWPDRPQGPTVWSIDYRFCAFCSSSITKEFGTPWPPPDGWSPLTHINFPINSSWHGAEVRVGQPTWEVHCDFLVPQQAIHGQTSDLDWNLPDTDFTDLGFSDQRWNGGQMVDLGLDFQIADHPFGLPLDVWPTVGFRWQHFDLTGYDGLTVKEDGVWLDPARDTPGDLFSFDQQYFVVYVGGQLRGTLNVKPIPTIAWKFQGDWGNVQAFNTQRENERFSSEREHGSVWHLAFTTEMLLTEHLSLGCQVDCSKFQMHGEHRLVDPLNAIDERWTNGVSSWSDQTALTAFVRLRR